MPTIMYQDENGLLSVEVGVDIRAAAMAEGLDISQTHSARDLSNSIKIKVNSSEAHFIQFVTRIVPDLYTVEKTEKMQWDKVEEYYMTEHDIPKWKVDTADNNSCFYDSSGVHKRTPEYTAMYDYPGGPLEFVEERAIFCTFITIDDRVTHKVQWSKQCDAEEKEFYTVQVQKCEFLPDWAIKTITEDAWFTNNSDDPSEAKIFPLPDILIQRYNQSLSKEDLLIQMKEDFLQPPENWITKVKMPSLFPVYTDQPTAGSSPLDVLGSKTTWFPFSTSETVEPGTLTSSSGQTLGSSSSVAQPPLAGDVQGDGNPVGSSEKKPSPRR